jgi:hypothetical protein
MGEDELINRWSIRSRLGDELFEVECGFYPAQFTSITLRLRALRNIDLIEADYGTGSERLTTAESCSLACLPSDVRRNSGRIAIGRFTAFDASGVSATI